MMSYTTIAITIAVKITASELNEEKAKRIDNHINDFLSLITSSVENTNTRLKLNDLPATLVLTTSNEETT